VAVAEFQYQPTRWAKLAVDATTTQADVDGVFSSMDTTGWNTRPTWDPTGQTVSWQQLNPPFGERVTVPVGGVVAVQRPYVYGRPASPSNQPQLVTYQPGEWSDSHVTYL